MNFNSSLLFVLLSLGIFKELAILFIYLFQILYLKKNFNLIAISISHACVDKPCKYGKCVDKENGGFKCICFPKWSGELCDKSSLIFDLKYFQRLTTLYFLF